MNDSTLHVMAALVVSEQAGKVMGAGGSPADFAALLAASAAIARNAALSTAKGENAVLVDQRIAELVALVSQTHSQIQRLKAEA